MLREEDILISDEKVLAILINKYLVNVTTELDLTFFLIPQPVRMVYAKDYIVIKVL